MYYSILPLESPQWLLVNMAIPTFYWGLQGPIVAFLPVFGTFCGNFLWITFIVIKLLGFFPLCLSRKDIF